jgi:CheY-like chemotaxis protein
LPGAAITVAENGFQGLVAIGRHAPRLVVTDIAMPHMDGLAMLREIAAGSQVKPEAIVAVSSRTPAQLARDGGLPADVHYIGKPIDPGTFTAVSRRRCKREVLRAFPSFPGRTHHAGAIFGCPARASRYKFVHIFILAVLLIFRRSNDNGLASRSSGGRS